MRRQRGVALITVLMVFFFASTIAVTMVSRQHLDIRRTSNLSESLQAGNNARSVETFALQLLTEDYRADPEIDHPLEKWAQRGTRFEVDHGEVIFTVEDLHSRFNLNNLADDPDQVHLDRLRLLLTRLELNPELADAIRDWIDPDEQQSGYAGAEDNEYLLLEPPYRAANAAIRDISELLLVRGVDGPTYQRLRPHVTALPAGTSLNVNAADPLVLQSLSQELGAVEADQIVQARQLTPFTGVDKDFVSQQFVPASVNTSGLTVTSEFFRVRIESRFGARRAVLESTVRRGSDGRCSVLARNLSRLGEMQTPDEERS